MDSKKNFFIAALVVLMLISSVWGQKEAGRKKELARENETLKAELQARPSAKNDEAGLELDGLRKKNAALESRVAELDAALRSRNSGSEEQKKMGSEQEDQLADLQKQLAQQQTALEEQEQKLAEAAKAAEREQQLAKRVEEIQTQLEETRSKLKDAEGASAKLKEEQVGIAAEAESMRAQVIGLEKIVEERSNDLDAAVGELESCKINNSVLIDQIAARGTQGSPADKLAEARPKGEKKSPPVQPQAQQAVQQ